MGKRNISQVTHTRPRGFKKLVAHNGTFIPKKREYQRGNFVGEAKERRAQLGIHGVLP